MTALVACLGFLIGSFPTGVVVTRLLTGQDVRKIGSGNIGASNVSRAAGLKGGVIVAVGDICKGVVPILIGYQIGAGHLGLTVTGLAAVLGHDFSIFLRFRGGKGVATTLGVALALAPWAAVCALAIWLVVFLVWRYTSLASLLALASLIPILTALHQPPEYVLLATLLFLLAAAKHWENILRLAQGRELKVLQRRPADG
jgi:glycerol-3-phosphate acyltransferase PlsY